MPLPRPSRNFFVRLRRFLAVLVAIPLLYFGAALLGALIPAHADWSEPADGIPIFIRTNGVHTWVVMPTVTPEVDWTGLAPAEHIRDPRYAGGYVAFGFGNRDFYLNTPTWGDLSLRTALAAAFGSGPSLVHVDHQPDAPRPNEWQRPLTVTPEQYRRLAAFISGSFARGPDGGSIPLIGRGYGPSDIFYEAEGPYHAFRTCNEWTGEALRAAGVRTGVWTPLETSIMWRLD